MRSALLIANPPAIVQLAPCAQVAPADRAQAASRVVLEAYWDTVKALGRVRAAQILASQGRPIPGTAFEKA